jgi:exonuclease III
MVNCNFISISTYNVQGLRKNILKTSKLFEYFKTVDVCSFQETHFLNNQDASFFTQTFSKQFKIYMSNNTNGETFAGICLCINVASILRVERKLFEIPGRALGVLCNVEDKKFICIALYVPSNATQRIPFFDKLYETYCENFRYFDEAILMGDFNFVEDQKFGS